MRSWRLGLLVVVLLLAVVVMTGATRSAPVSIQQLDAPSAGASMPALARSLVGRLESAHSLSDRKGALLAMMGALNLGVYDSKGKVIVRGSERREDDLYLYDFEVTYLAGAFPAMSGDSGRPRADVQCDTAGRRRRGRAGRRGHP